MITETRITPMFHGTRITRIVLDEENNKDWGHEDEDRSRRALRGRIE